MLTAYGQHKMLMSHITFGLGPAFGGAARAPGGEAESGGQASKDTGRGAFFLIDNHGGILSAERIPEELIAAGALFVLLDDQVDNEGDNAYGKGDNENGFHAGNSS